MKYLILVTFVMSLSFSLYGQEGGYHASARATQQLLHYTVAATLALDEEINAATYKLDLRWAKGLNEEGINTFLRENRVAICNQDSLTQGETATTPPRYFPFLVIRILFIAPQKDGTIMVHCSKYRSTNQYAFTTLLLQPKGDDFEVLRNVLDRKRD